MENYLSDPALLKLIILLEQYEDILCSHSQAKVISMREYRRIRSERDQIKSLIVKNRNRAQLL